ncbi:MAG: hypothetical protein LBJ60_07140, partial [Tannerellaceae bacterium]|nr:hypothetical protein [Tannerellaceae bacterium]
LHVAGLSITDRHGLQVRASGKIIRYIINQQGRHKKASTGEEYERIYRENGIVPEVPQPHEQLFNPAFRLTGREEVSCYPPIATLHWGLFTFRPAVCEETQDFAGDP